jgi:signal transduction histidine kinase
VDGIFKWEAATNIYRIAQEALNNLTKHSHAEQSVVTVERDVSAVHMRIIDDGVGFDTTRAMTKGGLGLTSIAERVRMLGGQLNIQSSPGKGTQLTIELPVAEDEETRTEM